MKMGRPPLKASDRKPPQKTVKLNPDIYDFVMKLKQAHSAKLINDSIMTELTRTLDGLHLQSSIAESKPQKKRGRQEVQTAIFDSELPYEVNSNSLPKQVALIIGSSSNNACSEYTRLAKVGIGLNADFDSHGLDQSQKNKIYAWLHEYTTANKLKYRLIYEYELNDSMGLGQVYTIHKNYYRRELLAGKKKWSSWVYGLAGGEEIILDLSGNLLMSGRHGDRLLTETRKKGRSIK